MRVLPLLLTVLSLGCQRSSPAPDVNRDDVEGVAAEYLRCPRDRIVRVRPVGHTDQLHEAFFEGCGRQATLHWGRGEVPGSGPHGWSANTVQPPRFESAPVDAAP